MIVFSDSIPISDSGDSTLQQCIEMINDIISEGLMLFSILSGDFWFWEFCVIFHLGGGARFD